MKQPTLEERVLTIEAMLPTLATKADILAVRADIDRWMLRTVLAAMGAALFGVLLVALA